MEATGLEKHKRAIILDLEKIKYNQGGQRL
ncbi:MAG: hypothetical protein RL497_1830 [Pseudomonadota bacterium]|jgi:hypothetical protein